MADEPDKCGNCLYWGRAGKIHGVCVRHAPTGVLRPQPGSGVGMVLSTEWPQTYQDQWCGDHFKKLAPEVAEAMGVTYPQGRI